MGGFQSKKSPGPDGLKPVLFPHLPDNFIKYLKFLYKACIKFSFTPTKWKDTSDVKPTQLTVRLDPIKSRAGET